MRPPGLAETSAYRAICARMAESASSLPLPDNPVLAAWASALNHAGHWAHILDAEWRFVFATDELLLTYRDMGASTFVPIGSHFYSAEAVQFRGARYGGAGFAPERRRAAFLNTGRYVLTSTPGGREELRRVLDPSLAELVDELQPKAVPAAWTARPEWTTAGADVAGSAVLTNAC